MMPIIPLNEIVLNCTIVTVVHASSVDLAKESLIQSGELNSCPRSWCGLLTNYIYVTTPNH
jgi:hypothetical protein